MNVKHASRLIFFVYSFLDAFFAGNAKKMEITPLTALVDLFALREMKNVNFVVNTDENSVVEIDFHVRHLQ